MPRLREPPIVRGAGPKGPETDLGRETNVHIPAAFDPEDYAGGQLDDRFAALTGTSSIPSDSKG